MIGDAQLLRLYAREKSETAFAELVRRHVDLVYSSALRRVGGDAHAAADVTQRVFLALARCASALTKHRSITGWLFICAKNAATDHVRASQRRRRAEESAQLMHELDRTESTPLDWTQLSPQLETALDQLNERDREAILLRFFENRSYPEIAATLSITADAARMRVDRSLDNLRGQLCRRGITSTGAALAATLSQQVISAAPSGLGASITLQAVGAGVANSPATLLINLMSTTKSVVSAGLLVAAFAVGLATIQITALHRADEALARAERDLPAVTEKDHQLKSGVTANLSTASSSPTQSGNTMRTAATPATTQGKESTPKEDTAGLALLAKHPELTDLLRTFFRGGIDGQSSALYLALNLSPAQIAQFEQVFTGQGNLVLGPVLLNDPDPLLSPEEQTQRLQAILGPSGYQQYQQDKGSLGLSAMQQIAGASATLANPLAPAQVSALSAILVPLKSDNPNSFNWDDAETQAATILNADQMSAFKAFRQQFQVNLALWPTRPGT